MMLPLTGVRIADFTHVLAGPFCTQLLADAGANVIKVEPPGGEYARVRGPVRVGPDGTELSSYSAAVNRGKRSLGLDLKNPKGFEIALRLIESADVVVENFAPGSLQRLGLDFGELRKRDPRLITVSISLFGSAYRVGKLATRRGLAVVAEGESSVLSMIRDKDGSPVMPLVALGDMATGMAAFGAISAALYGRQQSGAGCHLDISMVQSLLALNATNITAAQISTADSVNVRTAAYGLYPTKDGHVTIGVNNDSLFSRLATAMGCPELAEDPRYSGYRQRDKHVEEVDEIVIEWTLSLHSEEILERLRTAEIPCGRVATPRGILADENMRNIGYLQAVEDGLGGTIETPANPLGFSRDTYEIPRLAAHARELLAEIGVDGAEFELLRAAGAFGSSAR
jgi:crotonobetainyl-CoA:carnitine CoA-transferase CaiB-like acyl-CoA transferase